MAKAKAAKKPAAKAAKGKAAAERRAADDARLAAEAAADPLRDPAEVERLAAAFRRGVGVQVGFGTLGVRRKMKVRRTSSSGDDVSIHVGEGNGVDEDDDEASEKSMLRVSKVILDHPSYSRVRAATRKIKRILKRVGIPTVLQRSMYVVPLRDYKRAMLDVEVAIAERERAADEFVAAYPAICDAAKRKLGKLHDPADYPPVEAVSDAFYVRLRRGFRIVADDSLRAVDPDAYAASERELRREQAAQVLEFKALLRRLFADLVAHLADRLAGKADGGGPKVLRDAAVEKVQEFIEMFASKNLAGDSELEAQVAKMRALMKGVDAEALRDDERFRADVAKGVEGVKAALDPLVAAAPARRLRWTPARAGA